MDASNESKTKTKALKFRWERGNYYIWERAINNELYLAFERSDHSGLVGDYSSLTVITQIYIYVIIKYIYLFFIRVKILTIWRKRLLHRPVWDCFCYFKNSHHICRYVRKVKYCITSSKWDRIILNKSFYVSGRQNNFWIYGIVYKEIW